MSKNIAVLVGNLTTDPEMSADERNGRTRCTFCVAVNRDYLNRETGKRDADYIRIVAWGKLGELCGDRLAKGDKVTVIGSIRGRNMQTEDGKTIYTTEVKAEDVVFPTAPRAVCEEQETQTPVIDADDPSLPF